jgi:hypothetical protein
MAIVRKPQSESASPPAEARVMELIEKGGSVASSKGEKSSEKKLTQVFFRAPGDLIAKIEKIAKSRVIPTSRQTWLLEAIVEKLERERS